MLSSCLVSAGVIEIAGVSRRYRDRNSGGIQVWVQLVLNTILVSYQGCNNNIIIINYKLYCG